MKYATFQDFGEIEGPNLTGSYQTIMTIAANKATRICWILNECDEAVIISLDGGTTAAFKLPAKYSVSWDGGAAQIYLPAGSIEVKHAGLLPTEGSVIVSVSE